MPVDVIFVNRTHVALADLCSSHRPVEESSWALHFKVKLLILLLDDVSLSEIAISLHKRRSVPILFLVLVCGCHRVLLIFVLKVRLGVAERIVDAHILPQSLFDYAVGREVLVWSDEHLARCTILLEQLEEWVIAERNTLVRVIEQDFVAREASVLQLL